MMKSHLLKQVLSVALCMCLLPVLALAESPAPVESAVFSSDFSLSLNLHADGFPESDSRLEAWETFLKKLSIQGTIQTKDFLNPESRVYLNGGIYVNGKNRIPFVYDGYHSYRYFISPAIQNDSMHFQMHNFFEFMLKPYYYMELPTPYLALALYPEASYFIGNSYFAPTAETLAGSGTRNIPYERLYELCETLDLVVTDDPDYERAYFYFTSMLAPLYASDMTLDKLSDFEAYLDFLDPEQEGMEITVSGGHETYVLGETTVFEKVTTGDALSWALHLPDPDGYDLSLTYQWTPSAKGAALEAVLLITREDQTELSLAVSGAGLPCEGYPGGEGRVTITLKGGVLEHTLAPFAFDFRWNLDKPEQPGMPEHLDLSIDWLHPFTQKPALSLHYAADIQQVSPDIFVEGSYPQDDFFSLNESFLEEYKEKYTTSIGLALLPVIIEMPAGVLNDLYEFASSTGMLESLGL